MIYRPKRKAIQTLNRLLIELDTIDNVIKGNTWKASLKQTLDLYLGTESAISNRLDNLYFTRKESDVIPGIIGIFDRHVYDERKKEAFKDLIESAIEHIKLNGINKKALKGNFLSNFSAAELIGGIVSASILVFGIGNYFGKLEREREIIQYEEKIKEAEQFKLENQREINRLNHKISILSQKKQELVKTQKHLP